MTPLCRLILSNALPDRVATAVGGDEPKLYEIRADGTLWERTQPMTARDNKVPVGEWRRVGKRADWVSIWGNYTVVGLTADGTIWTWGIDPSRKPVLDVSSRIKLLQDRLKSFFGSAGTAGGTGTSYAKPPYQAQPRPLMRLVPNPSQPSNSGR